MVVARRFPSRRLHAPVHRFACLHHHYYHHHHHLLETARLFSKVVRKYILVVPDTVHSKCDKPQPHIIKTNGDSINHHDRRYAPDENTYLDQSGLEFTILKSLVDQIDERMSLDEFGERKILRIDIPIALQLDSRFTESYYMKPDEYHVDQSRKRPTMGRGREMDLILEDI